MPRLDGIGVAKRVIEANKWFDKLEKIEGYRLQNN
jgi:hypothetical protein